MENNPNIHTKNNHFDLKPDLRPPPSTAGISAAAITVYFRDYYCQQSTLHCSFPPMVERRLDRIPPAFAPCRFSSGPAIASPLLTLPSGLSMTISDS